MMKNILLMLVLASSLLFSGKSTAQQIPQGPFNDYSQLIATWQQFDVSGAGYVYLDNQLVFQREGFGPAAVGYYSSCHAEGLIRLGRCPENGPFRSITALRNYWSRWASATVTATYIYVGNQLTYTYSDGFGPAMVKYYVYCPSRNGYMVDCSQ
jgi:hypothetical protein